MAIDTENKRRSTIRVLPTPDGSIDAADRPQAVWIYSGISFTLEAVVSLTLQSRDLSLTLQERDLTLTLQERDE